MAITLREETDAALYPAHPLVGGDSAGSSAGGGGGTPSAHHLTHENAGSDQISVAGLTGVLANPQPPIIGAGAAQAVAGNDSRLTNARTPTSHATTHQPGGTDAMAVDAVAATGSLRTLGSGAAQACGGTDSRLSDARTPTAHATTHQPGGTDAMAVDAVAATGSLRTLGAGAAQACGGTDARLSDARTPVAHTHNASDINAGVLATARSPHVAKRATANVALSASATVNMTDLDITVAAGEVWVLDYFIPVTVSGGTVGLKPIFTLPAGATGTMDGQGNTTAVTANSFSHSTTPGTAMAVAFITAIFTGYVYVRAVIIIGGTGGTIRFGVATGASAAGNLLAGASVLAMKL